MVLSLVLEASVVFVGEKEKADKGFLWWGFLGPSPAKHASHPSPEVSVVTSSSLVVKEVGVDEDFGGCSSGTLVNVRLTGLIQS
jgi:hypothetical protein